MCESCFRHSFEMRARYLNGAAQGAVELRSPAQTFGSHQHPDSI